MSSSSGKIILKSMEGDAFEIEKNVAEVSPIIRNLIQDIELEEGETRTVPVWNATTRSLSKTIEYCKKHAEPAEKEGGKRADHVGEWDKEFVKGLRGFDEMFELLNASSYLDIRGLLDLVADKVADMIKDMTVEEVRDVFNIVGDHTEEEEAQIRAEHRWAFEL